MEQTISKGAKLPLLGLFQNVLITNGISIVLQNDTKDINSFAKWYKRHKNKRAQLIGSLLLTFLQKKLSRYIGKPKIRRRSQVWAGLGAKICAQAAARVKIQQYCFLILCLDFIGIDKIAGRFTSKVDDRKSSKIQFSFDLSLHLQAVGPFRQTWPKHAHYACWGVRMCIAGAFRQSRP